MYFVTLETKIKRLYYFTRAKDVKKSHTIGNTNYTSQVLLLNFSTDFKKKIT